LWIAISVAAAIAWSSSARAQGLPEYVLLLGFVDGASERKTYSADFVNKQIREGAIAIPNFLEASSQSRYQVFDIDGNLLAETRKCNQCRVVGQLVLSRERGSYDEIVTVTDAASGKVLLEVVNYDVRAAEVFRE
jgi:hypothetical protein